MPLNFRKYIEEAQNQNSGSVINSPTVKPSTVKPSTNFSSYFQQAKKQLSNPVPEKKKSNLSYINSISDKAKQAVGAIQTAEQELAMRDVFEQVKKTGPINQVKDLAVFIGREMITKPATRLFLSLQRMQSGDKSQEFTPGKNKDNEARNTVEKALLGEEKIADWRTESKNFLTETLGLSPEKAKDLEIPAALAFGVVDITPPFKIGKFGGLSTKAVYEGIAKGKEVKDIVPFFTDIIKGKPEELQEFAKGFINITDPKEVESILTGLSKEQEILKSTVKDKVSQEGITGVPSKSIVGPNFPSSGLNTNSSPSLTRTLEPEGASTSTRYTLPSQLYSLADESSIYSDYTKFSKLAQANVKPFTDDLGRATGTTADVRVKKQSSFEGKIERYRIAGKDPSGIADTLAGRVIIKESEIPNQLKNIQSNFEVLEVQNFFETPTSWGYKGVNIKVRLPNKMLAEIQIHTPESVESATRIHKLYEKWRNLDLNELSPEQIIEMKKDQLLSNKIANTKIKQAYKNPVEKQQDLIKAGTEELQARQATAELAKEERSLFTKAQIASINRLKKIANSKAFKEGDIETIRKKYPSFVESTIQTIREVKGESLTDEEALKYALSFSTKADTVVKLPTEIIRARALSSQVKAFMQGVRTGAIQTKEQIKEAQTALLNLIRESDMGLSDKGKLLALIKNVQSEKDLEKAFVRVEKMIDDVIKRNLKNDILSLQKKIINSPSIAIDYKAKVKELTKGFALKGQRESTLARLEATQKFLQSEIEKGNDVEIPSRVLKSLELLNRIPFEQITTSQLEGLKAEMELLEELGKTKLKSIKQIWELQKDKILKDISIQNTKPIQDIELIKPEIGERLTITQKFKNFIWSQQNKMARLDRAIAPMDTIFDLLDGGNGTYNGSNFRYFKGQVDAGYGRYLSRKDALQDPVIKLAQKYKLNDSNFERMGVVAAREQDGGIKKLIGSGFTEEQINKVTLSKTEREVLDLMRSVFDSQYPEIKDAMRKIYNQPVEKVKNYFSFMTDWKAMDESEVFERFGSQAPEQFGAPRKNVEQGFTKSRTGGVQKIKINALDIFLQHTDNTSYLLELGETTKMLGEVASSPQYGEAVGGAGQLMVREWLDVIARKGGAAGAQTIPILDILRKNVGAGILGLKLSTVAIQPTSFIDGIGFIGAKYGIKGITNFMVSPQWRKFVGNMPEIIDRLGGEFALRELTADSWLQNAQRKGFIPLQVLDQMTAGAIAAGAYERKMIELGKAIDLTKYDPEALAYAQMAVRRTQSSGAFKDVPLAISRGAMTGNRSLDRAMLQFQNFLLTRWSRIRHDAFRAGIAKGDPAKAIPIFTAIILSALATSGIRLGVNKIQNFITGKEDDKSDEDRLSQGFIFELTGNVPFLGTAVSMAMYDGEMFPILDAPKGVISGLNRVITSKSESAKLRGFSEFAGSTGALFGIPGSAQAEQLANRAFQDKKDDGDIRSRMKARFNKESKLAQMKQRMKERFSGKDSMASRMKERF